MDMEKQDGINLIEKVISDNNLWTAYDKVYANKGVPGVDGLTVYELKSHMTKHYEPLKRKLRMERINHNPSNGWPFQNLMGQKDIWESLVS